ncbi:MAG: hypothetical protein KDC44_25180, partial [Phaeodactylibacter sp.]|nr:hypothetical protein [Phaeodactylibacter sp.]
PETMEPALRYTQSLNQLSTRPPGLLSKHPTLHLYQPDLKAIAEAGAPSPQLLDYFRPQGGLAGLYGQALLVPAGSSTTGGWTAGLNMELQFPRRQFLELNGDWTGHLLYAKDPATISQYPMVPPNDPLDELHELKGNLQFLQLYTGIGQRFRPDKKLQPMVSLGIAGIRNFRQAIRYEYYSANGEYKLNENFRNKDWSWSNVRLGTGIDWQLADRLSLHSRLSYQHNFDKNVAAFIPLKYWTIRLGLNYHFEKK